MRWFAVNTVEDMSFGVIRPFPRFSPHARLSVFVAPSIYLHVSVYLSISCYSAFLSFFLAFTY